MSIFGMVMKNVFHVVAVGPGSRSPKTDPEVNRALYATEIQIAGNPVQFIEIHKHDSMHLLRVFDPVGEDSNMGSPYYGGAPMPFPRWTAITPHFLEEDAWYDTVIIKQARTVTMPTGWNHTPNPALTSTTNYHAYFKLDTFVIQDDVGYGHRARSEYVLPKHLLWEEFGLRGLKEPHPNDLFLGGGQYADKIGRYLCSTYEDKTYDDSKPLFPSMLALTCTLGHRDASTKNIDAFFRRLHQDDNRLLENSRALSCALPLACRARPMALLSFFRHIALFRLKINAIGPIRIKQGAPTVGTDCSWEWQVATSDERDLVTCSGSVR